jgi:hypothetical protein
MLIKKKKNQRTSSIIIEIEGKLLIKYNDYSLFLEFYLLSIYFQFFMFVIYYYHRAL